MQAVPEEVIVPSSSAYFCYTFLENKQRLLIPIVSNKYYIDIKNNFAEIKSVQTYKNPFQKPLEIHYSIPTDPMFALTRLIAIYSGITIQGLVKEREQVKAEYKEGKQLGSTVMMATNSTAQKSVLKVRLGNIQPFEEVRIEVQMVGQLKCQLKDKWTLRIPSHIAPRYQTQTDLIKSLFTKLLLQDPSLSSSYVQINTTWDFKINLFSSKKILSAGSSSHQLDETKFTDTFFSYSLAEAKIPQKDLQFSFQQEKFDQPICTLGKECLNITFSPPKSSKSNYDLYKGQYIFLLDRSGSMQGQEIQKAKESLILFLQSLPTNSLFNIISFGSDFQRMFKASVPYNDDIIDEIIQNIEQFDADMGGTQILSPLEDIIQNEKEMKDYIRHVILITDGQVQDSDSVVKTISAMKKKNICTTHTVGIGNGVSFDMIRRGAIEGGGQHMFIMNSNEMKKQIIFLLESITSYEISNFSIEYDKALFNFFYPLVPSNLKRGRQNSFFLRFNNPIPPQILTKQQIKILYFDEENQKQQEIILKLAPDCLIQSLNKYSVKLETDSLYEEDTEQSRALIIKKSVEHQVLTPLTGYICIIQQNANANNNQGYLLEMKNSLEGVSLLYSCYGPIYVKTLTGKTIKIDTRMNILVKDLKECIQNKEGIPPNQQRLLFGGKQMEDDRTLQEYNIIPQSVINLVLRLRGGGWGLIISIPNGTTLSINGPPEDFAIADIYAHIIQNYPNIPVQSIIIVNKNKSLDPLKTIKDYGINHKNCQIQAIIPQYFFGSTAIIKQMKTSGFWQLDMNMLTNLGLAKDFQDCLKNNQGIPNKAMTSLILGYLKKTYPSQQSELRFIYKKVEKYLSK